MTQTCLSAQVKYILCDVYEEPKQCLLAAFDKDGLLQWNVIRSILPDSVEEETLEYFVSSVEALSPVLKAAYEHYVHLNEDCFSDNNKTYLQWTSEPGALIRCMNSTRKNFRIGTIQSLLICTSILERSLGDLYLLKGKNCPSMLKDLLLTDELKEILGNTPIQILRILIGPPVSLNLRNLVWHGFPSPGEIYPQYFYMLICVMMSIGKILQESAISASQIPHRSLVIFPQVNVMENILFKGAEISNKDIERIAKLLNKTTFVQESMIELWIQALNMYKISNYGDCVCLLLPQLEHGLRRIFTIANNCPQRMLTAENTVLFTTLDEILSPCLEDGRENKLQDCLGDKLMMVLLDLLSYPAGPRLRDKVSHGETSIMDMSEQVAKVLIAVCVLCVKSSEDIDNNCQKGDEQRMLVCEDVQLLADDHDRGQAQTEEPSSSGAKVKDLHDDSKSSVSLLDRLQVSLEGYRCQFHPIALVQSKILKCAQALEKWNVLSSIISLQDEQVDEENKIRVMKEISKAGYLWSKKYYKHTIYHHEIDLHILEPFHALTPYYQSCLDCTIPTLYNAALEKQKNKKEEILRLLHQITQQIIDVAEQIRAVVKEWNVHYENKTLHSRQRKTYLRMTQSVPLLSCGLRLALAVCTVTLYATDFIKLTDLGEQIKLIKLLKFMVKYTELLTTYTGNSKNRWKESSLITVQLTDRVRKAGTLP